MVVLMVFLLVEKMVDVKVVWMVVAKVGWKACDWVDCSELRTDDDWAVR